MHINKNLFVACFIFITFIVYGQNSEYPEVIIFSDLHIGKNNRNTELSEFKNMITVLFICLSTHLIRMAF